MLLLKREQVRNLKKSKKLSSNFLKIKVILSIKFNNFEVINAVFNMLISQKSERNKKVLDFFKKS